MTQNVLTDIYNLRFRGQKTTQSAASRDNAWKSLYERVLHKYVKPEMTVVDLGSGPGSFINQVSAHRRIAVDLDINNKQYLNEGVEFHCVKAQELGFAEDKSIDLIFSSNLFEHLGSADVLIATLKEAHRILRDDSSKLIVLMPNVRYVKWDFFNFIDHNLPLNETSLKEVLELCNFEIIESHKKFFPYSANGLQVSIPQTIIDMYLLLPPRIRPKAQQMYFVAKPVNCKK